MSTAIIPRRKTCPEAEKVSCHEGGRSQIVNFSLGESVSGGYFV